MMFRNGFTIRNCKFQFWLIKSFILPRDGVTEPPPLCEIYSLRYWLQALQSNDESGILYLIVSFRQVPAWHE